MSQLTQSLKHITVEARSAHVLTNPSYIVFTSLHFNAVVFFFFFALVHSTFVNKPIIALFGHGVNSEVVHTKSADLQICLV